MGKENSSNDSQLQMYRVLLDSISAHVALLDQQGVILDVNRAWRRFEEENSPGGQVSSLGVNYLELCDSAGGPGFETAKGVANGLRAVISGELQEFALEYPCHSPTQKRWFNVRVVRMLGNGPMRLLMTHENITNVKLAQKALERSEAELRTKSEMLAETNAALKVILRQREEDRAELEEKVTARVAHLVLPYTERLQESGLNREQTALAGAAAQQSDGDSVAFCPKIKFAAVIAHPHGTAGGRHGAPGAFQQGNRRPAGDQQTHRGFSPGKPAQKTGPY